MKSSLISLSDTSGLGKLEQRIVVFSTDFSTTRFGSEILPNSAAKKGTALGLGELTFYVVQFLGAGSGSSFLPEPVSPGSFSTAITLYTLTTINLLAKVRVPQLLRRETQRSADFVKSKKSTTTALRLGLAGGRVNICFLKTQSEGAASFSESGPVLLLLFLL